MNWFRSGFLRWWRTTYSASLTATSTGWNNDTLRAYFAAAAFSTSGKKVRLSLHGPATGSNDGVITECWLGHAGATKPDFDGTQVQVTFNGGSATGTAPAQGVIVSDPITYTFDKTKDFIVSVYFNGGTNHDQIGTANDTNCTKYEKDGVNNAAATSTTGYSTAAGIRLVSKIEVHG